MEACGHYPWFERLLAELGFELWFGDAAGASLGGAQQRRTGGMPNTCWIYCASRFPRSGAESGGAGRAAVAGASPQAGRRGRHRTSCGHGASQGVQNTSCGRAGARRWSSCPCCRMRPNGESSCCIARRTGSGNQRTGPASGGRSAAAAGGGAADDASRSRSGNGLGPGADLGTGQPIRSAKQVAATSG